MPDEKPPCRFPSLARLAAGVVGLSLLTPAPLVSAGVSGKVADRLEALAEAARTLSGRVPDSEWKKARCVTVLLLGKGGFIVGGQGGPGAISCRSGSGGAWSAPYLLEGGGTTFGAQIGGAKVSVLMTFKNIDDIEAVTRTIPVLGGAAQATAGTASSGVGAGSNPDAGAGVFTVSQGEGLYAGATFEGLAIGSDDKANRELYGASHSARAVLLDRTHGAPPAAAAWMRALSSR